MDIFKIKPLVVFIGFTALLASCNQKSTSIVANTQAEVPVESSINAIMVNASETSRPWYAERLEKLGFIVFPKPNDLPAFTVAAMDGKIASIKDVAGKVVLLNIWATWCPPCRAEMPSLQALYEKTRDVPFAIFAISTGEDKTTVEKFIKENKYTFPFYLDQSSTVGAQLASRGIPTSYVLDKQGRAIAAIIGSRMYDGQEVIKLIKELAEKLP